jgi:MYXO-CTERM domain-containing protein
VRRPAVVALALALGVSALAPEAAAYVRYLSKDGKVAFAWPQTCIALVGYPENFTSMMPLEEITSDASGAASAWSGTSDPCTDLAITVTMTTAPSHPVSATDHENSLVFRTTNWCLLLSDGSCDPTSNAYDSSALALTSVSASTVTGHIKDADIEVNGFFMWADLVAHPELDTPNTKFQDLQNALTHEMGHLIGLDHTCVAPNTTPRPVDNLGNPVPDCNTAPPDIVDTTMFPSATPGDTSKRTLSADDQQAVCDIYPVSANLPCIAPPDPEPSACNCAAGPGGAGAGAGLAAAALASLFALRARRRRGGGPR